MPAEVYHFLSWEITCVISYWLLTLLSYVEVQTWVSSSLGSETSFGSEQTHLFKASSEEPLLCHTCCALLGAIAWELQPSDVHLDCPLRLSSAVSPGFWKEERGLGAGQKHIHHINKNKSFIPKGHNSSKQQWNRTENAIPTSLGLLRVNKLALSLCPSC